MVAFVYLFISLLVAHSLRVSAVDWRGLSCLPA